MKGKLRTVLTVILGAVFLVSSGLMLRQYLGDREVEGTYQEALELALAAPAAELAAAPTMAAVTEPLWVPAPVEEDDPHMEELSRLDLAALRQVNPDVIGWIRIPDTKIDYPFLQGEDNEYYLTHTWEGEKNAAGSIFLECMNSGDLTDFNTILYGHNMNSGAMFAGLRKYTSQNFFEAHPYVYLLTDQGVWRFEIFSAYKAPVESHTYGLSFRQEETKEYFIAKALQESQIDTAVAPEITDRVLTLSTCSGAGYTNRWVVHARLKMVELPK